MEKPLSSSCPSTTTTIDPLLTFDKTGEVEGDEEFCMTRDEFDHLKEAIKKKEFRQLLSDYAEEIIDPKNQALYQDEMRELEKSKGNRIHFLNPIAGFVLKTSIDGVKKCFINVCGNPLIRKPTFEQATGGTNMQLPYAQSPAREDYDKGGKNCLVYDVIFHPEVFILGSSNITILKKIEETAVEAVEKAFKVVLDKNNIRRPKLKYKGIKNATVIKYKIGDTPPTTIIDIDVDMESNARNEIPPQAQEAYLYLKGKENGKINDGSSKSKKVLEENINGNVDKTCKTATSTETGNGDGKNNNSSKWTTPKYSLKYRSQVDLQDCVYDNQLREQQGGTIPEEIILTVDLPLLRNSTSLDADVTEDGWYFELKSDKTISAGYWLRLKLPYQVYSEMGKAKFETDTRKLIVCMKTIKKKLEPQTQAQCENENQKVKEIVDEETTKPPEERESKGKEKESQNKSGELKAQKSKMKEGDALRRKSSVGDDDQNSLSSSLDSSSSKVPCFLNAEIVVKGILKRPDSGRSRSKSESWLDHMTPREGFALTSLDSLSEELDEEEEEEVMLSQSPPSSSDCCSKSVRFSSSVHQQLFRSNSSIEGKKKKNQKKAKNKRKARERKASESSMDEEEVLRNRLKKPSVDLDSVDIENGQEVDEVIE